MDMIISINKEIIKLKYRGYTPTHIRIHPETFKKICKKYTEKEVHIPERIYIGEEIKLLGLTVWLDKNILETECMVYDMNDIMQKTIVMHDFIRHYGETGGEYG